ncbi:hypothetical protein GQ53DRAFT_454525 [Thozetella sp. PMI_491]|nr:hypothetical protein GQ53DRAFT_454525 [Thozetella sp. PMI_491]
MASKIRSSDGCWTCRLRRKKCDEERPACSGCLGLEIDCLYSETKPEWMDNGEKQKERADWLKAEVKRRAGSRREKKYMQPVEKSFEDLEMTDDSQMDVTMVEIEDSSPPQPSEPASVPTGSTSGGSYTTPASSASALSTPAAAVEQEAENIWQRMGSFITQAATARGASPTAATTIANASFEERELSMAMLYLDYVFPYLFPFYRPPLMEAGRGWLLVMLSRNKALFHAALTLASFFFAMTIGNDNTSSNNMCRLHNAEELQLQQELALKELQNDIVELNRRGYKDALVETSRVMASIVQLLTSEVAFGSVNGHWEIHLNAASELFLQIMGNEQISAHHHGCWTTILDLLGYWPKIGARGQRHPWNSDQASLRFFTAVLLHIDVLGSTALGTAPRLHAWHQHLLLPNEEHGSEVALSLDTFVGVENWVVMAIGEIAALAAWKKEMKQKGSLSITQLVTRAAAIEKSIRARMFRTDHVNAPNLSTREDFSAFRPRTTDVFGAPIPPVASIPTVIWGQATLTYLNVVLSGYQPACPEIRESVGLTMQTLAPLGGTACLRVVVWPLCVTGCLAMRDQEDKFRTMISGVDTKHVGSVREALSIMENVWSNRAAIEQNPDSWDLSACLRGLGHTSLLF